MNKKRRRAIEDVRDAIQEAHSKLTSLQEEEQESYDNLPDGLSDTEQGQKSEQAAIDLEEAAGYLDDAMNSMNDVTEA